MNSFLSKTNTGRLIAAVGATALVASLGAGPAFASQSDGDPAPVPNTVAGFGSSAQPSAEESFCWSELDTGLSACAASEEELAEEVLRDFNVIFTNSEAPISLTLASTEARANSVQLAGLEPRATWVLGTVYADRNGVGYSRADTGSSQPCLPGGGGWLYNFPFGYILNDNVESVYPIGPCRIKVYADVDRGGSSTEWLNNSGDIGGMRNQGSSIEYKR